MRGFTLIEIMVVGVIIGILSAVAAVVVIDRVGRAKVHATKAAIKQVATALGQFQLDQGRLPERLEDLRARPRYVEPGARPQDGSLTEPPLDGRSYELVSLGADGRTGGEGADADIAK
jgi:general secretion pathway protein G